METREGFGERGNVAMFDDFPTVTTVAEALSGLSKVRRGTIAAVLDELAFCMKTATRLGRVVRIGDRWWGHPQTYGSRQMEVVDEYERTGISADEFDLWAVLDPADLIALVATRTGIVAAVVDAVVSEFCGQVQSFHVRGIHFRTPPRELGTPEAIVRELARHLHVLTMHDQLLVAAERAPTRVEGGPPTLACRDRNGGWFVVELHVGPEGSEAASHLSWTLDAVSAERARAEQPVRGLVVSDGYSHSFVERVMRDDRVMHVNLRSLDLPICRAQRWAIRSGGHDAGWVAVAGDGRTVVAGGGAAFPTLARLEPFERIPLDWEQQRLWPLPLGDRSTPGG
ncbi:MAG: hypothetical protein HYX32_06955 [Actinobacteria bacterium]|nr:hypothetical protein [Actinomycetota bacterium]